MADSILIGGKSAESKGKPKTLRRLLSDLPTNGELLVTLTSGHVDKFSNYLACIEGFVSVESCFADVSFEGGHQF